MSELLEELLTRPPPRHGYFSHHGRLPVAGRVKVPASSCDCFQSMTHDWTGWHMAGDDFEASAFECSSVPSPRGTGSLVRIQRIGLDGGRTGTLGDL